MPLVYADFHNIVLDDEVGFNESITYRPLNNPLNDKTIQAIVERQNARLRFSEPGDTMDYESIIINIRATDNIEGHVTPAIWNRDGTGDVIIYDGTTWYVRDRLQRQIGGVHRLLCTTSPLAMLDELA